MTPRGDPPTILLYTRHECSLCDEAEALLRGLQEPVGFRLEPVDIDADPALRAEYNDWVPVAVVASTGEELFRLGAKAAELEGALRAALEE